MRGSTHSRSTRRRLDRGFDRLAQTSSEVNSAGRAATAVPVAEGSFFTRPHGGAALVSFDDGVGVALRHHLRAGGLVGLAESVDQLELLGRRLRVFDSTEHELSEVVYQMH